MPEPQPEEPLTAATEQPRGNRKFKHQYTTAEIDFIDQDINPAEASKSSAKFHGMKSNQKPPLQKNSASNFKNRNTDI